MCMKSQITKIDAVEMENAFNEINVCFYIEASPIVENKELDEMSEEDFHFCFVKPDGELDEEASPMFIKIDKLLKPMSTEFLDNIVKPLKDLMKGVSIGA